MSHFIFDSHIQARTIARWRAFHEAQGNRRLRQAMQDRFELGLQLASIFGLTFDFQGWMKDKERELGLDQTDSDKTNGGKS